MFELTVGDGIAIAAVMAPVLVGTIKLVPNRKAAPLQTVCELHHEMSNDMREVKKDVKKTAESVARIEGALGIKGE